mmetsp:Transcript_19544/g.55405  ORF Transcript_19544/g.55405 Transcript_19544/m.55405 type:complete len:231 (-) Transcript_19544:693-1385(-)
MFLGLQARPMEGVHRVPAALLPDDGSLLYHVRVRDARDMDLLDNDRGRPTGFVVECGHQALVGKQVRQGLPSADSRRFGVRSIAAVAAPLLPRRVADSERHREHGHPGPGHDRLRDRVHRHLHAVGRAVHGLLLQPARCGLLPALLQHDREDPDLGRGGPEQREEEGPRDIHEAFLAHHCPRHGDHVHLAVRVGSRREARLRDAGPGVHRALRHVLMAAPRGGHADPERD